MREIKLRSYNEAHKKFYYFKNGRYYNNISCNKEHELKDGKPFDWNNAEEFTGINDKNFAEIYEGDIIKYFTGQLMHISVHRVVKWDKEKIKFNFGVMNDAAYIMYNVVVIGNIYDNKELLGDTQCGED